MTASAPDARPTVVVLRALGLGDFLSGVPAYRALARAFSAHRRILAAPLEVAPLAFGTKLFDGVRIARPLAPLAPMHPRPDVAVNLHGAGPQSHRVLLATEPDRLLAFAHGEVASTRGFPAWRADEHETVRWGRLLSEFGIAADPCDLELEPPERAVPAYAHGATIVHPGAASGARRWPPERWARVAEHERASGRVVLVTGSVAETALATDVVTRARLPADALLAGRTDVLDLAALVAAAGRVVCGDTGVAHLATAFGTPSVVLFGPTSPALWGPPADRPWHRVLWTGATGDPHGAAPGAGLLAIGADAVIAALATLPSRPRRPERA